MNNKGEKNMAIFLIKIFILILIIILQIIVFKYIYFSTKTLSIYAKNIFEILKICLVLAIIYKEKEISYKVSWIILILLFPVLGILLYTIFGNNRMSRKSKNKIDYITNETNKYLPDDKQILDEIKEKDIIKYNQINYIRNASNLCVYKNTNLEYMESGEKYFKNLLKDIENAKKYILIEYFIISKSKMWEELYEVLNRKANEGIKIYIIYDYLGSITRLPKHLRDINKNINVEIKAFNPIMPIIASYLNYRDHRKITVIDGEVAYTGGINIGDEYINLTSKLGYWKDTGVRLEGNAAWGYVIMFLRIWESISKQKVDYNLFKSNKKFDFNNGFIIPYCDSPYNSEDLAKNVYINLINTTKKYLYITTPYLIMNDEMINSLCVLSKSGVDVRIIIPGIPDKKLVYLASKSFCTKLIKNGVKVYKYSKGFIHAKTLISDDENAVVGSVNFDYRSFYLNYETAVYMYNTNINDEIKEDYFKILNESEEIKYDDISNKNIILKIIEAILRIFSPLL